MSIYSELARAARETELAEQNEKLHAQVLELGERLAGKERAIEELHAEVTLSESTIRTMGVDLDDSGRLAQRLSRAMTSAVEDLRLIGEVPLGELEASLKAVADRLADANGEHY
ncbi:hypothetical protein [Amycolatopsis sp. NPDC003731]